MRLLQRLIAAQWEYSAYEAEYKTTSDFSRPFNRGAFARWFVRTHPDIAAQFITRIYGIIDEAYNEEATGERTP